jgi:hypothetical protein
VYIQQRRSCLTSAKNYLDITWEDAERIKLSGILSRGIVYLDHRAGVTLDYDEGTEARELLFDYCRYVRADACRTLQQIFSRNCSGCTSMGR